MKTLKRKPSTTLRRKTGVTEAIADTPIAVADTNAKDGSKPMSSNESNNGTKPVNSNSSNGGAKLIIKSSMKPTNSSDANSNTGTDRSKYADKRMRR